MLVKAEGKTIDSNFKNVVTMLSRGGDVDIHAIYFYVGEDEKPIVLKTVDEVPPLMLLTPPSHITIFYYHNGCYKNIEITDSYLQYNN